MLVLIPADASETETPRPAGASRERQGRSDAVQAVGTRIRVAARARPTNRRLADGTAREWDAAPARRRPERGLIRHERKLTHPYGHGARVQPEPVALPAKTRRFRPLRWMLLLLALLAAGAVAHRWYDGRTQVAGGPGESQGKGGRGGGRRGGTDVPQAVGIAQIVTGDIPVVLQASAPSPRSPPSR